MKGLSAFEREIRESASLLRRGLESKGLPPPRWAVVLGSGLQSPGYFDAGSPAVEWELGGFAGLPAASAAGHLGKLQAGMIGDEAVLVQRGRVHYYETLDLRPVCFTVFLMKELGVERLILTNAAGALDGSFREGGFMLVRDHINLLGTNPLLSLPYGGREDRFLDLSGVYDRELGESLASLAKAEGITLHSGVLVAVQGPCYETPAESRFLRAIGGDAVSMSLVPEAVCAHWLGLRVAALSCLTNLHGRERDGSVTHRDVLAVAARSASDLERLLRALINRG